MSNLPLELSLPPDLQSALQAGALDRVVAFFAGMTEAQRQAIRPAVIDWRKQLEDRIQSLASLHSYEPTAIARNNEAIREASRLQWAGHGALLACGTLAQVKEIVFLGVPDDTVAAIFKDRQPSWISEYVESLSRTDLRGGAAYAWRRIRALMRAGLCSAPTNEFYALGAIEGLDPLYYHEGPAQSAAQGNAALAKVELLLKERDWLETTFWRLFEIDGSSQVSLAGAEKYGRGWIEPLVELSRRGVLPRDRLLDASLDALSRDFIQFRAGWFSRFHEALEPTVDERVVRVDRYLELLASSIPPTVAFAIEAITLADEVKPLPAARLLPALQPVLVARGKAVVKAALRLIGRSAKRESQARSQACLVAANALLHEAPDVQKAVFALLARYGDKSDPDLRAKLNEMSGAVVASQRVELRAWVEPQERDQKSVSRVLTAPAEVAPKKSVPRTDPSRAIVPIATLDDLLDVAGRVLERPDNPEEIERLIDGMSRIPVPQTPEFARRLGPLQQQAFDALVRDQMNHARAPWAEESLATLVLCWLTQADIFRVARRADRVSQVSGPSRFLLRRIAALGRDVSSGRSRPLLSAPTHIGGWVEPRVLVERWLAWQSAGIEPSLFEQVLALLRLAPENREDAQAAAMGVQGEEGEALRCALGKDVPTGPTAALWLAAWRSRQPLGDLPEFERVHPSLGPDAGSGARMTWTVFEEHVGPNGQALRLLARHLHTEPPCPDDVDDALLPVLCHMPPELPERTSRELLRWTALLWPANRDAFFAGAVSRLGLAMLWSDIHDRETAGYFGALADPHVEVGEITSLALAMGLSAQDAALRGHARDDLITLIENERVDVDHLGMALSKLLGMGEAKSVRWTKSLAEVARVTPKHARVAVDLVQRALRGDPGACRNLGTVLELLVELLSETGAALRDPAAQEYLARVTGSGKAGRLAKQLRERAVGATSVTS